MIGMAVRVQRVCPDPGKRVIAISDIHGNLPLFQRLLQQIRFCKQDNLILLGDFVEKGPQSLATLQYIRKLSRTYTVYAVCGNCDEICLEVYKKDRNEQLLQYLLKKRHTLLGEMCREQGIRLSPDSSMKKVKELLRKAYREEIEWVKQLPHILHFGNLTFAHAAVYPGSAESMDSKRVMKTDGFMNLGYRFPHLTVVGHWPVVLYDSRIQNCSPRFDRDSKIISIDGGNILEADGQLNAVLFEDAYTEDFICTAADDLPKACALTAQEEGKESFHIRWLDSEVRVLKKENEFAYCEHSSTKRRMWIPRNFLYEHNGTLHTQEISDYQPKIKPGDIFSVHRETSRGYLIKRNGISGWYYGTIKYLSDGRNQSKGLVQK